MLQLAERCANILFSVRSEIDVAGPAVAETLADPLSKLVGTFAEISFLAQT
jgi:hypothetical protein